jgi:RNA polymerase sigma factor (sigma-70 family)
MGSLSDNYACADAALEPLCLDAVPEAARGIADPSYTPEQWIEIAETQAAIHRWLKSLPERDRVLLERLFWAEETQADIARSLKVSRAAVCKHVSRLIRDGRATLGIFRNSSLLH